MRQSERNGYLLRRSGPMKRNLWADVGSRRIIGVGLCMALVVALFLGASCAVNAATGDQKIVLHHLGYLWHGDTWHKYMEDRIADFERLHPNVTIERSLSGQRGGEMEEKFTAMVAGGVAPDVSEMTLSQGGNMAPKGVFLDLRPLFSRDKDVKLSDFAPVALRALTWVDGAVWGVPLDVYPVATYYNIDMFEQAGLATPRDLSPEDWSWDYATRAARKLTMDTSGDGNVDQWGIQAHSNLIMYGFNLKQAGGGMYDRYVDPTRCTLNDPRTIQAYEWIADIYHREVGVDQFSQGRVGFSLVMGPTGIMELNKVASFRWDVGPPLWGPDNNGGYVAVNSLQISRYTKQPDLAWEWVKFLAAHRENTQDFVRGTTRLSSYAPTVPLYSKLIHNPPPGVQHFGDVLVNPKSFHPPIGPITTELNLMIYYAFWQEVVEGRAAVKPVMEALVPQIDAMLAEARR
jgi:multiple sugar transport system substrate-binding protein